MHDIKESDWKTFKPLREQALERFCQRVLDEVARIGSDQTKSRHERYIAIYQMTRERDKEIEQIFDHLRRSTAPGWRPTQ
jgi:regulator of sigma D